MEMEDHILDSNEPECDYPTEEQSYPIDDASKSDLFQADESITKPNPIS